MESERSKPIDIKYGNSPYTSGKHNPLNCDEYGLKQNFFDPSKASPPNQFISKLKTRMDSYYSVPLSSSPPFLLCFLKKEINSNRQ